MSDRSDEKRYPSLEEFDGWYNLGYERPDGVPVLHSRRWVPEFEHGEFFHLFMAERQWFEQLVPASALKPFDPIALPPMYVLSSADDRTLRVLSDFDYLTVDLLRRIQGEFLGRHPFWRVILGMGSHPSCSIVIYPDVIRFGNLPLGVDPEAALQELIPRATALAEVRMRPERAQLAFIQQRLPDAIRDLEDRPFLVAGVLDNYLGNYDRLVIFLLIHGRDNDFRFCRPPGVEHDFLWAGGGYGVDAQGRVICEIEDLEIAPSAEYSVALWYPPADYRGPLTITDRASGKQSIYELSEESITRTKPVS